MKRTLLLTCSFLSLLWAVRASASAPAVYITPDGAPTGACVSGTQPLSFFNNSASWGSGAAQIGPDTVVHACGTFTGTSYTVPGFAFRGSGTAGHPITLKAEAGFRLTSPVWGSQGNAAITSYGYSHIVIDGNSVGVIENTANGGGLANHTNSNAIYFQGGADIVVKGWTVQNICQHQQGVNGSGCVSSGSYDAAIYNNGDSNVTITNNTIHDSMAGIAENGASDSLDNTYTHNTIYNCNWGIQSGAADTGHTIGNLVVAFNEIYGAAKWDEPDDGYHHNGIFLFVGQGTGEVNDPLINGNYVHGDMGVNDTSYIFLDNNTGSINRPIVVNNVLASTSAHAPANAFITGVGQTGGIIANNTIVGNSVETGEGCIADNFGTTGATIHNNLCIATSVYIFLNSPSTIAESDYNLFYGAVSGTAMQNQAVAYASVAQWTTALGFDAHSVLANPNLSSAYFPPVGSSAAPGLNLSSLGIAALAMDQKGNPRPTTGSWTIGALQIGGVSATPPAPPTNLVAVPH